MKKYIPKILIVDDDRLYLKQFNTILKKEINANYYFSSNAGDAIELINSNSYAIILLDVNIPEKNGFEIARDIRNSKLNKRTPIIFITGISIDDHSVFEGYKAGAVDYLSKPVSKFILFSKIKTFLELDIQKNELLNARDELERSNLGLQKKDFELEELNRNLEKKVKQRTQQLVKEVDKNIIAKANLQIQANQLKENNLFLENLLETIPNPVYYKNEKGEYLGCNKEFEEFISIKKEDIIGKTIYDLVPKEFADKLNKLDSEIIKSGEKQITEINSRNFDSSIRNLILYKSPFKVAHSGKSGVIGTVVDITDLTKAKELLKIQHTIDYISSLEKGKRDIFKNILNSITEIDWVDSGGIYLMDEEKQDLTLVCHKGISRKFVDRSKYFPGDSAQAELVLNKRPIYTSYQELTDISGGKAQEENLEAVAVIPLVHNNIVIGALNVASKTKNKISESDKTGIETLASRIGNLIVYAQTQEKLKTYQKELELKIKQRTKVLSEANLKLNKEIEIHKQTKLALADSENKYRSIFENAQDGIVLYDAETLNLVEVNEKAYQDLGYTYDEIKRLKYNDFAIYEDENERKAFLKQLFAKGKISFQAKHKKKDGEICYRVINASILNLNDKRYIQGIIHDISDLKGKEEEIKLINRNLEKKIKHALKEQQQQQQYIVQKSKLESLGELAAGIAHEINQPLGIMTLAFENLESKFNSGKITNEYLKQKTASIIENIDRIRDIINHIRIFSREYESIVLQKINVNKTILDVHKLINTQYKNHNINVILDLFEDSGFTVGSTLKLEQVLLNLLSNAKYALNENEINYEEKEYVKTIKIKTSVVDNRINLMLEDNGTGINPKHLNKIFDPFFTTKPEWDGTGLGLSIVYGLIKEIHGEIKVKSKQKEFTRFDIFLPRFPEKD